MNDVKLDYILTEKGIFNLNEYSYIRRCHGSSGEKLSKKNCLKLLKKIKVDFVLLMEKMQQTLAEE